MNYLMYNNICFENGICKFVSTGAFVLDGEYKIWSIANITL